MGGGAVAANTDGSCDGWAGAVVVCDEDPEGAFGMCRALRKRDAGLDPVIQWAYLWAKK